MRDLNQNQLILLTLLVSFVTSIATGIMTTSLLSQAPVEVTRTINNVLEKTIQQVASSTSMGILSPTKPTQVTTVVVKEEDQVIASINKNLRSVVRVVERDSQGNEVDFFGLGLVLTKDGVIVTKRNTITAGNQYVATLSDGSTLELNPTGVPLQTNYMLFKPLKPAQVTTTFIPVSFADGDLQLGQSVVSLGGDTSNAISVGRVVSLATKESGTGTTTVKYISAIETDVSTKDLVNGSPIFNLSGDVSGIELSDSPSKTFAPVSGLKKELPTLLDAVKI